MSVYNGSLYLRQAIDSILNQSFTDFEFIIINDGSTDDSEKIILSYSDPRIKLIRNDRNLGLVASLNKGISAAAGTYIARMDADDMSLPLRFERQIEEISKQEADAVFTAINFINRKNEIIAPGYFSENIKNSDDIRKKLPYDNCLAHPTALIKASVLKSNLYDPAQKGSEDWDLWLTLASKGFRLIQLNEILLHYRFHGGSVTQTDNRQIRTENKILAVRRKFIKKKFSSFRFTVFVLACVYANMRTRARIVKMYWLPPVLRFVKRLFTINPFKALKQYSELKRKISQHKSSLLLVFPYSHFGGAERVHADITHALSDRKPLVLFAGIHKESPFIKNFYAPGAAVVNVGFAVNYFLTQKRTKQLIDNFIKANSDIKILGCNSFYLEELCEKFAATKSVSDLTHDYTFSMEDHATISMVPLYTKLKHRVFVSRRAMAEAEKLYDYYGLDDNYKSHFRWIVNATDVPFQQPERTPASSLRVLYVGRNSVEKRPHLVFEIIKRLSTNSRIHFSFAGDFEKQTIPNTHFYGVVYDQRQMQEIWANHDVLILTSRSEGFPMVIMEAMAHGVVPVSTPVGDIPLHVTEDVGSLLKNESEEKVVNSAAIILSYLLENRDVLELKSAAAYAYASKHFSKERFKKQYLELFG